MRPERACIRLQSGRYKPATGFDADQRRDTLDPLFFYGSWIYAD